MLNRFIGKFDRVAAVVPHAIKKLRKFLIKLLEKNLGRVGIRERHTQITAVNIYPVFQRQGVGHLKTIRSGVKHKPLVRVGANRFNTVFHGKMHIRGTDEVTRFIIAYQSIHHQILYFVGVAAPCSELSKSYFQRIELRGFIQGPADNLLIRTALHAIHFIMQFRNQRKQRNFPKDRAVPLSLHRYFQILAVLHNGYLRGIIMIAAQKIQIRQIQIWTGDAQELFLIACEFQFRHGVNTAAQFLGKARRERMVASVNKCVAHFFIREKFNHRVLHGDFIEIIVEKRFQPDISHRVDIRSKGT